MALHDVETAADALIRELRALPIVTRQRGAGEVAAEEEQCATDADRLSRELVCSFRSDAARADVDVGVETDVDADVDSAFRWFESPPFPKTKRRGGDKSNGGDKQNKDASPAESASAKKDAAAQGARALPSALESAATWTPPSDRIDPLPGGWEAREHEGAAYYEHIATGKTTWERPSSSSYATAESPASSRSDGALTRTATAGTSRSAEMTQERGANGFSSEFSASLQLVEASSMTMGMSTTAVATTATTTQTQTTTTTRVARAPAEAKGSAVASMFATALESLGDGSRTAGSGGGDSSSSNGGGAARFDRQTKRASTEELSALSLEEQARRLIVDLEAKVSVSGGRDASIDVAAAAAAAAPALLSRRSSAAGEPDAHDEIDGYVREGESLRKLRFECPEKRSRFDRVSFSMHNDDWLQTLRSHRASGAFPTPPRRNSYWWSRLYERCGTPRGRVVHPTADISRFSLLLCYGCSRSLRLGGSTSCHPRLFPLNIYLPRREVA